MFTANLCSPDTVNTSYSIRRVNCPEETRGTVERREREETVEGETVEDKVEDEVEVEVEDEEQVDDDKDEDDEKAKDED